jgi:hypothetical protein
MIQQNMARDVRRQREELCPVLRPEFALVHQPEIRFVDQGSSLESVSRGAPIAYTAGQCALVLYPQAAPADRGNLDHPPPIEAEGVTGSGYPICIRSSLIEQSNTNFGEHALRPR